MADILVVAQRLSRVNIEVELIKILKKKSVQNFIIRLNTRVQLYKQGEDSLGIKLSDIGGGYKASTIKKKKRKGQPTNRVTLYDTGAYYGTFTVEPTSSADYVIDSNPEKGGRSLFDRWGQEVEGLNEENQQLVLDLLEREFWKKIHR